MSNLGKDQGNSATSHSLRPSLTVDTRFPTKRTTEDKFAQSAPVGTRQERGIPPMYQTVDRHCAKLSEMMNSPTWRNQNPGPHVPRELEKSLPNVDNSPVQSPLSSSGEDRTGTDPLREYKFRTSDLARHAGKNVYNGLSFANEIHLGRDSEAIKILGIDPFPQTPEAPNNTFIILAAASGEPGRPHETFSEGLQASSLAEGRFVVQGTTAECSELVEETQEDDYSSDRKRCSRSPSRSASSLNTTRPIWEANNQHFDDDSMKLIEQDQAIHSINHRPRSPCYHREASPGEKQRFRGLLDRLHHQYPMEEATTLIDPAIISFVTKRENQGTPTKGSKHVRSDSGYASPSVSSRRSTGVQSRIRNGSTESVASEAIRIQHEKDGSKDSGFQSPSKNSTLNPAAREFSFGKSGGAPPVRTGVSVCPGVSDTLLLSTQQPQGMMNSLASSHFGHTQHQPSGPWLSSVANANNPLTGLPSIQQGPFQFPSVMPSPLDDYIGTAMPPPPAIGPSRPPNHSGLLPGLAPALVPPVGLGLPGFIPSPNIPVAGLASPFHQQLPSLVSCNDPAHQNIGFLGSQARPAAAPMALTTPNTTFSRPAAPPNFIPKHVPKPKFPDAKGQQNWELMHELRKMHEPGYAQKCKDKQKKRYMKQAEKRGGAVFQA